MYKKRQPLDQPKKKSKNISNKIIKNIATHNIMFTRTI